VDVAQLVRALVCGAGGRGFEPRLPPEIRKTSQQCGVFFCLQHLLQARGEKFMLSETQCSRSKPRLPPEIRKTSQQCGVFFCLQHLLQARGEKFMLSETQCSRSKLSILLGMSAIASLLVFCRVTTQNHCK
jgi:hypothetical protein